jgi:hypothetical protein
MKNMTILVSKKQISKNYGGGDTGEINTEDRFYWAFQAVFKKTTWGLRHGY